VTFLTLARDGHAAGYAVEAGGPPPRIGASDQLMVCVSAGHFAPDLLRAGAEAAKLLQTAWYAVYVEPEGYELRDASELQKSITLAESLGGSVVRVTATDPVEGLVAFARRESISHAVFATEAGGFSRDRFLARMTGVILHELQAGGLIDVMPLTSGSPDDYRRPSAWLLIWIGVFTGLVLVRGPAVLMLAVAVVVAVLWCRSLEGL